MPGGKDEPIRPSQRQLANQRLITAHQGGAVCECCRPGYGCAALDRAVRELSEAPANNR